MCNPMAISVAFSVVSTLAQGYMANQQAKDQAKYQEGVGKYNARVEANEAQKIANKGVEEENEQRRKVIEMQSEQKAKFGASGVDPLTGSALQVQEDTLLLGEVDALRVRRNYREQSESLMDQSRLTLYEGEAQADLTRQKGRNALTGSVLSAGGTVISSGVSSKWFTPSSAANSPNMGAQSVASVYKRAF